MNSDEIGEWGRVSKTNKQREQFFSSNSNTLIYVGLPDKAPFHGMPATRSSAFDEAGTTKGKALSLLDHFTT